jgi:hypothetical protein
MVPALIVIVGEVASTLNETLTGGGGGGGVIVEDPPPHPAIDMARRIVTLATMQPISGLHA